MGVKISSLAQIPSDVGMDYYIYFLTSRFPYESDLALRESFELIAKEAAKNNFVVIQGLVGEFG